MFRQGEFCINTAKHVVLHDLEVLPLLKITMPYLTEIILTIVNICILDIKMQNSKKLLDFEVSLLLLIMLKVITIINLLISTRYFLCRFQKMLFIRFLKLLIRHIQTTSPKKVFSLYGIASHFGSNSTIVTLLTYYIYIHLRDTYNGADIRQFKVVLV